jgi:SpoVK/Ycf46/Vps4 family AAA+-type ATPase
MHPGTQGMADLSTAFGRLDALLARAICLAQTQLDSTVATDPYRGLHIRPEEVNRLLSQPPGVPLLWAPQDEGVSLSGDAASPLARLAQVFDLAPFDFDVLLIALAPEFDLRYERIYAFLQDDVTRRRPSVDLVLNLLCQTVEAKLMQRARFASDSPLLRSSLVNLIPDPQQAQPPLLAHFLKLDDQIVRWLLGQEGLDRRLLPFCERIAPRSALEQLQLSAEAKQALLALVRRARTAGEPLKLYFHGRQGAGKRCTAEALAKALGMSLLAVDLGRGWGGQLDLEQILKLSLREARFREALLFIEGLEALHGEEGERQSQRLFDGLSDQAGIIIVAGIEAKWVSAQAGLINVPFSIPDFAERRACWQTSLGPSASALDNSDLDALAQRFRLTPGQIANAVDLARRHALWRAAARSRTDDPAGISPPPNIADLLRAARAQTGHSLATLARKIEPKYVWDDLVLPADQRDQLREICTQFAYRHIVYGAWGFERKLSLGKGLNCLFSGPPGTGKTMAAEVIANELQLDLYKIDLSQVVSKYIGETEKNLDRIFTAAEDANAILFFDEADALFGKRSEAKDAHDRYANIEVGYLLQKMEEYEGVAILATNLKGHLDDAFLRRLQIIVEFPFPDENYRRRIWQVVFPREAPLGEDVDFALLAREVRLAGGNIKNIGLAAAFYAAKNGGVIHMPHLARAARREHQKLGRSWNGLGSS